MPMIYAYIRVSTDKQSIENQRFEILKYADVHKLSIDKWVEETISSKKKLNDRILDTTLNQLEEDDVLIVSELSRLGRNLMEVMSILHACMEKEVKVHTIKENYELGNMKYSLFVGQKKAIFKVRNNNIISLL